MTVNSGTEGGANKQPTALSRSKQAMTALALTSRKLRMVTSGQSKIYKAVGLRPRPAARLLKLLGYASIALFLVVPNLVAVLYFGFIASDQYSAETRFTVRTSEPITSHDQMGKLAGIPSAEISQDTQIISNYVVSRAMLTILEKDADFVRLYSRDDADWYARLPRDSTLEERLDYWQTMIDRRISPASGIVTLRVKAFSAEDAQKILQAVVQASEVLINDLNVRIWTDATASAQTQVEEAAKKLSAARAALQVARNTTGIFTVESSSNTLAALITQLEGERIALENTRRVNSQTMSPDAPQMQVLARQIESKNKQIKELREQVSSETATGDTLADSSNLFSQLTLEQTLAEQQLTNRIKALETLQYLSQQQMMYLDPFLAPTLPESAEYPRRLLSMGIVLLGSLVVFGLASGALAFARRRLA